MEIYADVVFFINFMMDFFIFWIVSKLIRRNISIKRILAASASASFLYCLLLFIPPLSAVNGINILSSALIIIISVFICFRPKNIKELIKFIVLANISAFTMGGAGTAVFYYTNLGSYIGDMIDINIRRFPFKMLIFSSLACFIILKMLIQRLNAAGLKRQSFCGVKLYFEEKKIELTALIDTGNSLCEPISGRPVIISEFKSVKDALPEKIKLLYYENKDGDIKEMISVIEQCENKTDFLLIPFSSLGKSKGIVMAVKAKKAEITYDTTVKFENLYVAVYNAALSKEGNFNSLINPEILKY